MQDASLMSMKQALVARRSAILNKSVEFSREQREEEIGFSRADEAEIATVDTDLTLSYQIQERDRLILLQIDRALSKLADGSYGRCEDCGVTIAPKRLEARPFALYCIECQEEHEAGKQRF
jgi:DnaK suppressor protein